MVLIYPKHGHNMVLIIEYQRVFFYMVGRLKICASIVKLEDISLSDCYVTVDNIQFQVDETGP